MNQSTKTGKTPGIISAGRIFKTARNIGILGVALLLSACAGTNSKFNCNARGTGECSSLDQVNKQVDQGAFNAMAAADDSQTAGLATLPLNAPSAQTLAQHPGDPIRYGETVQRIWLAPYEDDNGNYHEPSYVYTVIHPGHWIGVPAKEISDND